MKKTILFSLWASLSVGLFAQLPTTTLTFTAQSANYEWIKLDSVIIQNLDRGWTETIVWPDTQLILMHATGIDDYASQRGQLWQTGPNPFQGTTTILLNSRGGERVFLQIADVHGKSVAEWSGVPEKGVHQFKITLSSPQLYLLNCLNARERYTLKLVNQVSNNQGNKIEYVGTVFSEETYGRFNSKGLSSNTFYPGDHMEYTGFCVQELVVYSTTIRQEQTMDEETITFTFPLTLDKSCPGTPTVTDFEGNVYHTVQIGKQCWLRENLKSTYYADGEAMILGDTTHDHDIPFYFRYNHSDSIAAIYGMLYTWAAAMRQNEAAPDSVKVQGACPDGWHIPTDAEFCEMEFVLAENSDCMDNVPYFGISDGLARKLCAPRLWQADNFTPPHSPGYWQTDSLNYNTSGFSVLPAGYYEHGAFFGVGWGTSFWTATEFDTDNAIRRYLYTNNAGVNRYKKEKCHGFNVRCIMDETFE